MVKVQKPNPKTFKSPNNGNKSNVMKKKPAKDVKAIPSSNVTAKKAKTKLVEKAVQENEIKTVEKGNKPPTWKQNANKKKGGLAQSVETKTTAKKLVGDIQKQPNQVQKKKAAAEDDTQKIKSSAVEKPQKKKGTAGGKPQKKNVPSQNKPQNKKASAEDKHQERKGTAEDKSQVKVSKKQKKEAPTPSKKAKKTPESPFESQPFEEDHFNKVVNSENIKKISQALKSLVEKQVNEKKTSIFSDFRYFLNVCSYKIPNCPKRIVKLNLQHSMVDTNVDDVVIIVPDLQRGAKVDYEPTIQHYEDLFREAGVTGLKIVPFNQLRKECTTFEAKRKFANTYDYFLCDGRIVNHVVGFCGSYFQKPRTTFHAVRLNNPTTYKLDVERALKRSSYKQLKKGDLISIPVGTHRYSVDELADNIQTVIQQLKTLYPGGLANIRNMHLKIDIKGTSALPLYVNLAGAPAEVPNVVGLREKRMIQLKKEANEVLAQFSLSKTGDFVKLDKSQVERKRQIQEARKALLSESAVVAEESDAVPAKKSKKAKKEVEPKVEEVEEDGDDDEEGDDDEDGDDDDEEADDDDEEADDDDEEGNDDEDDDDVDEEGDDDDE